MDKSIKTLILTYAIALIFFTSLYIGTVPTSVFTHETLEFQETPIGVIDDKNDIVSYSELSGSEQELFRDAVDDKVSRDSDAFNSNSVVQLDGSYYTLNITTEGSLLVPFVLIFIVLIISGLVGHYSESFKSGLAVFVLVSVMFMFFMPYPNMLYMSDKPVDVETSEGVLDVNKLDKESKELIYSYVEGGNSVAEKDVMYTELSELPAQGYIRNTYSYISSDGELYKLKSSLIKATEMKKYQKASIIILFITAIVNILYVYQEQSVEETS